jgi:hypothetical protein
MERNSKEPDPRDEISTADLDQCDHRGVAPPPIKKAVAFDYTSEMPEAFKISLRKFSRS